MSLETNNIIPIFFLIALGVVGVIIFLFVIFNHKKNNLLREKLVDELAQQKKMHSLELNALRSQMNPHFVYNSLNAIQYYIQRNEVELSEDYLVKFSKLVRLFFEYSRKQTILLKEEVDLLTNYLEIEKLRFEDKINYTIEIIGDIDTDELSIPSMILQPIVENAINHGLFHKSDNGNLTIRIISQNADRYKVEIEDDGIGINTSKEIYKRSSKKYQSSSTQVLEERIELLSLSNEWEVTYKLQDLSEIGRQGTLASLTFKQL